MSVLVVRCISSFAHGVVLYVQVKVFNSDTLEDVAARTREHVQKDAKYKPLRTRIDTFDTFKIYGRPGQAKPQNLVIAEAGEEFSRDKGEWGGLRDLGIEPETEISFFCGAAYAEYKTGGTKA